MCFLIAHEHILKNEHDELMLTGVSCDHVSAYVPRKQDRQLTSDGGYKGRRGGGRETGDEWGRNRRKRSVLVNVTWSHLSD